MKNPTSAYHAFASKRFRKVDYYFAENILAELQSETQLELPLKEKLKQEEFLLSILN